MPQYITLAEMANRKSVEGAIAEQLDKISPLLSFLTFEKKPGGIKKYGVRETLPTMAFRGANEAITPDTSIINPYEEACAIIENNPWIDKAVVSGSPEDAMAMEMVANLQALSQTFGNAFYYGDRQANAKELDGLYSRILAAGSQFVDGSGTGSDLTSIYVVNFGLGDVQGVMPEDEEPIQAKFIGEHLHSTLNIMGYLGHVYAKMGIAVCNPFAVCQYGNIESAGSSNVVDLDKLDEAILSVKGSGQTIALMNKTAFRYFNKVARASVTRYSDELGRFYYDYAGVPIYIDENIVNTETAK